MGKRALCKKIIEQRNCDDIDCEGDGGLFYGVTCPFIDECPVGGDANISNVNVELVTMSAAYLYIYMVTLRKINENQSIQMPKMNQ